MDGWTCHLCHQTFFGRHRCAAHMRNVWKLPSDPSRCDYVDGSNLPSDDVDIAGGSASPSASSPSGSESASDGKENASGSESARDHVDTDEDDGADTGAFEVPLITAAVIPTPLHELSRRKSFNCARTLRRRWAYCIEYDAHVDVTGAKNFVAIQDKWEEMLLQCKERYSDVFWKFFLKLHTYSQVMVDTALVNVKKMQFFPSQLCSQFPSSRRIMMSHLDCIHKFWSIVRHTCRIDLSHFDLPSGTRFLDFQFIDPIWGWLLAARLHHPGDLHWRPFAQHRTQEPLYGGGIQFGECFKHAFMTRREGSYLMMMALHWDGTYGRSLDITPIAVAVANINNCDKSKETCIGYMPFTPDQKQPEFKKTNKCTRFVVMESIIINCSSVNVPAHDMTCLAVPTFEFVSVLSHDMTCLFQSLSLSLFYRMI